MTPQQKTNPLLMVSMLILAVFFSMASRAVFSPLMPTLQAEMGFSLSAAGTLFLLISISYGITMLLSGFLSARIGHGKTITVSLGMISLGLMLAACSQGIVLLAVALIFIGAAAGIYPPSGLVMINTKIDIKYQSTALSFHEIGPNAALLLAPLIVLSLEPWFGWRGVLLWMAFICALAAVAFQRWGAPSGGMGTAPDFKIVGTLLRKKHTILGMSILCAALAGLQGVYVILPAYLVTEHHMQSHIVNLALSGSRVAGILLLMRTGKIINRFGRRRTISGVLLFSACFTGLIGVVRGPMILAVVIAQPAIMAILFPALLSSIAEIGDPRYQNITYSLIITVGVSIGSGVVPALLGIFGDMGIGWAGFIVLALLMIMPVLFLRRMPDFGEDRK
ncbi:MFS transporter [Oceanispirochaeta sp.]|jgi:NNP family nitrate/nitrite transporter-like MFS transporter|uniref:MFS transporter n=1 Tax=Oceanispirochaeta sp. TaxID=2035350 RepID=UPI002608DD22|nr:MFS transporter [Oceanispirochaeta sp.]MDA3959130.1 MFS transporter [Oceanispirochaeta sp.]